MHTNDYRDLKTAIHSKVLNEMDLESLNRVDEAVGRERVASLIRDILQREKTPLALAEREMLIREVIDELFGYGPIQPLLNDPSVSDILVNGSGMVYVERSGILEKTDVKFNDDAHLMRIIERIVSRVGRRVDESSPMVDARLPDGSRVNAIIPPLALDGPTLSIRRFGRDPLTDVDLLNNGSIAKKMIDLLKATVQGKTNILI